MPELFCQPIKYIWNLERALENLEKQDCLMNAFQTPMPFYFTMLAILTTEMVDDQEQIVLKYCLATSCEW
jgi:hypothetical protein